MDNFFDQLYTMLGPERMLAFLKTFLKDIQKLPMLCTHDTFRPLGQTNCFSAGSSDLGKAMGIRKTVVFTAAAKFANVGPASCVVSTKVRVHQLFMLATCNTNEELMDMMAKMKDKHVVLHLCGHGICTEQRPLACVNPDHLALGTQAVNVKQTGAHDILALAHTVDEYRVLVALFQRDPAFEGLF